MNPNNNPKDLFYKDYYGKDSEFTKKASYVVNDSPSGRSSYMKVRAGSYEYLMIGLSWYDLGRDMDWFENILRSNKDKAIDIINVHLLGMLTIKMDKIINHSINLR